MKKLLLLASILTCMFIFSGCESPTIEDEWHEPEIKEPVTNEMEIFIFGIGRSDAILITTENYTALIDTGERQNGSEIVRHMREKEIRRIDYLIITHFDNDHVGGAADVISAMNVANVIVPNYARESTNVSLFNSALQRKSIVPTVLTETMRFSLDNAEFWVNPASFRPEEYEDFEDDDDDSDDDDDTAVRRYNDDEYSIVVSVTHGRNNFLFTGDMSRYRLREIMENEDIADIDYNFYKVPRHGRRYNRSLRFIRELQPRFAVITGFHPDDEKKYRPERPANNRIIETLEEEGAEIFFTMTTSVYAISNGERLSVNYVR